MVIPFSDRASFASTIVYRDILYTQGTGINRLVEKDNPSQQVGTTTATLPTDTIYDGKLYYAVDQTVNYILDDPAGGTTPYGNDVVTNPDVASDETGKVKLDKTLTRAAENNYSLTLEGYTVAGGTTTQKIVKAPTDFVVVVDESGSMSYSDIPASYSPVTAQKTLEQIAEGNYYVNVNGEYYRVYAKRGYLFELFPSNTLWTEDVVKDSENGLSWFQSNTQQKFTVKNQYYLKEGSAYRPVNVEVEGKIGTYYVQFYYYPNGGTTAQYFQRGDKPVYHNLLGGGYYKPGDFGYSAINSAVKTLYPRTTAYTYSTFAGIKTGMCINYDLYKRHVGYTGLYYRDVNGDEHAVNTAVTGLQSTEYCDSKGNAVTEAGGSTRMNYTGLYQAGQTMTRISALKAALRDFAAAVAADSDDNGYVDNRVAVVGFASSARNISGGLIQAGDGNGAVSNALTSAINSITANGGTQPETGLNMAKSILDARNGAEAQRNTVVIFFTDGRPGDYDYVDQYLEANDVVEAAYQLKTASYEPKIYSIGVFGESDGNPLLGPRSRNSLRDYVSDAKNDDYEYEGGYMEKIQDGLSNYYYYMRRQWRPDNTSYTPEANDTIFDYMSVVSSNYPNARTFIDETWVYPGNYPGTYVQATEGVRGTGRQDNDYYRMASTQATLVAAFEDAITKTVDITISDETTSVLDTNAEIRDKINIDMFDVSNAYYTVKKVPVKAVVQEPVTADGVTTYHWSVEPDTSRQTETILGSTKVPDTGVIIASGLDYASEYVNRRHDGYKLVVEVTGLVPKQFNTDVNSNYGKAGLYPSGAATPMVAIDSPVVNVYKAPVHIVFKNYDGSVLQEKDVPYGAVPEYLGETPYKPMDDTHTYVFKGWDKDIVPALEPAVYIAQFDEKAIDTATVVVDFNAPMILAEESGSDLIKNNTNTNGKFDVTENNEAYYQLNTSTLNGTNTSAQTALDLTPYSGSDSALIYGRQIDLATGEAAEEAAWRTITAVPATNIYFSDNTKQTPVKANDQIGFNEGVIPDSTLDMGEDGTVAGKFFYQFTGTRIDVYAATTNESGTILGTLYAADGTTKVAMKSMMMSTDAENAAIRFNAPVLSFSEADGIVAGNTYILKITSTAKAQFRLDGIRVYNGATNDLEKNAKYINLRDVILNESDAISLDADSLVEGVTFYTDKGDLGLVDPQLPEGWSGSTDAADNLKKYVPKDYKNAGPKNEVYLATGDAIGFVVPAGMTAMVSMRAPEVGSATVEINGVKKTLNSAVDMYYPVTPNDDGIVVIGNVSGHVQKMKVDDEGNFVTDEQGNVVFEDTDQDTLVSIINVKLTGDKVNGRSAVYSNAKLNAFASRLASVAPEAEPAEETPAVETPAVESPAVESPAVPTETPAEESPEPSTQPSVASLISQLFSSFVNRLFGGISRIFGN